jgi:hypothetical protein
MDTHLSFVQANPYVHMYNRSFLIALIKCFIYTKLYFGNILLYGVKRYPEISLEISLESIALIFADKNRPLD